MSTTICVQCHSEFVSSYKKQRYCSRTCANQSHRTNMRAEGARKRQHNIDQYLLNPLHCKHCQHVIPYHNKRHGVFCSKSCSASHNNHITPKRQKASPTPTRLKRVKSQKPWIKTCPISGETFTNKESYINRPWSPYPNGRIRTIKLLAATFNVELGKPDTIQKLNQAQQTLRHAYENDQLSTLELKRTFGFSCSESHVSHVLKVLGINRRSFSESASLSVLYGRTSIPKSPKYASGEHIDWRGLPHYYRSSYELSYYHKLDQSMIEYETESIRVPYFDSQKNENRVAIPDIIIGDVIIEVKSCYHYDRVNMQDKFKSYQQNGYKLILYLDGIDYIIGSVEDLPSD